MNGGRGSTPAARPAPWVTGAVLGLVVMATWTLVIKYLAPILYFASERAAGRAPAGVAVMWDFWWAAHLALAWMLWRPHPRARAAGLALSSIEIVIVTIKFVAYLHRPDLSFWRLLWFTNKVYVLLFFVVLLVVLLKRKGWPGPAEP